MKTNFFDNIIKLFEEKFENRIPLTHEQQEVACEIINLVGMKRAHTHNSSYIATTFEKVKLLLPPGTTADNLRMIANQCYMASMINFNVANTPVPEPLFHPRSTAHITKDDYFRSIGKAWRDLKTIGVEGVGYGNARLLINKR